MHQNNKRGSLCIHLRRESKRRDNKGQFPCLMTLLSVISPTSHPTSYSGASHSKHSKYTLKCTYDIIITGLLTTISEDTLGPMDTPLELSELIRGIFFNAKGTKNTTESQRTFNCFIFGNGKFQETYIIVMLSIYMMTYGCIYYMHSLLNRLHSPLGKSSKADFVQMPCCLVIKLYQTLLWPCGL